MYKQGKNVLIYATLFLLLIVVSPACTQFTPADPQADPIYTFARQRIEETRRQQMTQMPAWLKKNREVLRDQMALVAQKSFEETGIWFLARGAGRGKDEQETVAVWGDLLYFGDLETLPGYSEENHQQAIKFWQGWQNLETGRLYNPLYQDPQNPEVNRHTPGNRNDYSAETINVKYIPGILAMLGAELPRPVNVAIDNLLAHKSELYAQVSTARNYGETMAHYMMLTDYRHDELLDAMELCLEGFRDPTLWGETASSGYCLFGSGMIGVFMNWEDLPFDQALKQWFRFEHGCKMNWRFVVGPYGNWVNVIPKKPEVIYGHADYDVKKYGLKARNQAHWAKEIRELIPQQEVALSLDTDGKTGEGSFTFLLTKEQLEELKDPYLSVTWSGAYEVLLNGEPVKTVQYNLADVSAGWYVPRSASRTLHVGENIITVKLTGPGKEQKPGAPLSIATPSLQLGVIDWR